MLLLTEWLWTFGAPIVLVVGTVTDVLTIIVLRHLRPCTSNFFLQGVVCSDLCLLYFGLLPFWIKAAFRVSVHNLHSTICKLDLFISFSSGVLFSWLTVAMIFQQAISVLWPRRVISQCTRSTCYMCMLVIVALVILLHSHIVYGFGVKFIPSIWSYQCTAVKDGYRKVMLLLWNWADLLWFYIFPFLLLLISNIILVWKIVVAQAYPSTRHKKKAIRTMLISGVVSLTFLSMSLPVSLFVFIAPYVYEFRQRDVGFLAVMELTHCLVNLVWFSSSSATFCIYYLTNKNFQSRLQYFLFKVKMTVLRRICFCECQVTTGH